ncbi:hypothetical protein FNAPI_7441 [Fusarium napiforme]|uniref:Uncharacterized protein n=1 Tax=Fusarium napiforme TaxID=42672 RepID=A0A8H5J9X8_9HYPO|nr:hypothetical protein FNAPI_7441 [Fusarium napiforme]
MLVHYCTQSFWPGFEIGSASFYIPPFALDYNTLVAQGPALTLYAILSLCGPEKSPDDGNGIIKRAFDPPLAEFSWIYVFGRRLLIDSHAMALMNLVDSKGGIHNVKYAGFQASFNYMDLVRATQKLPKPHLPVSQLYGRVKETHDRVKFFGDLIQHHHLATLPGGYTGKKPVQIDASRPPETTADHWVNENIQTALLIFSLGVTCPISYALPYHHAALWIEAAYKVKL